MPTTSSPWASPSSPAGRRLLQSEPATADDIPVLDDATLALGAALVAASDSCRAAARRRRTPRSRSLAAAALVVGLLAAGTTAGLDRPAPAATPAAAATAAPLSLSLGRAAGVALGAEAGPVAGGQVAAGLIAPTEAVRAEAKAEPGPPLAQRMGTLVVLAAEDPAAG